MSVDPRIPRGLPLPVEAILIAALKDLGIKERGLPNRGPQVDRFQPRHIADRHGVEGVPWCASAVCTWWHDGLGKHPLGSIVRGADTIKDKARALGMWRDVPTMPRPGDAFVLLHSVDTKGFDKGHCGIVLRVDLDGHTVQCIEGNARNAVRLIERKVPSAATVDQILGFASPVPESVWASVDERDWPERHWERGLLASGADTPGGSTR